MAHTHGNTVAVSFDECPDCWPFPGSGKPVGHQGRHRRIPREIALQQASEQRVAACMGEETIMRNLDQALPEDDKVLSPEIPLAHAPDNMAELPPLSLEWKDSEVVNPQLTRTQVTRQISINKRSRDEFSGRSNKSNAGIGSITNSPETTTTTEQQQSKKVKALKPPTISKEPATYKAMSDEQLSSEITRLQELFDSLRHKHRGGVDCHRCQAKTALQRARRVQTARANGTPEPAYAVIARTGSKRTPKARRGRQKRAPHYSATNDSLESHGAISPARSQYSRYRSGSRTSWASYQVPGASPSLCPVDTSIPIGTQFSRTSMIGSFQLPSSSPDDSDSNFAIFPLEDSQTASSSTFTNEQPSGFTEWTTISNLNENDMGGSLLENKLGKVPRLHVKEPQEEDDGWVTPSTKENMKPPHEVGQVPQKPWEKTTDLPSVADQVYPVDASRVFDTKAHTPTTVADAGPVA